MKKIKNQPLGNKNNPEKVILIKRNRTQLKKMDRYSEKHLTLSFKKNKII